MPLPNQLQHASRENIRADMVAGLTTAIMLVPQGMAYAMLAGLDPIHGLYASTLPLVLYALSGSSRQLAVGPVAMDSLMVAAGLLPLVAVADNYAAAAALLALMVGGIQLTLGVLRAGFLVRFLAHPVLVGFTTAAAVIIGLSQLKSALGVALPRSQQAHIIVMEAIAKLGSVHLPTLALTLMTLGTLMVLKAHAPKFPRFLLVVIAGTLLVWGLELDQLGVATVGEVPAGLPPLGLPDVSPSLVGQLFPIALAIAMVAMMEAIAVAKRYDAHVDPNRELMSIGLANVGAGLVAGYPVTGGFSRTAVNAEAGARSPLAGVITAAVVTLTLLLLTDAFYFLPNAVLASIIIAAVSGLVDIAGFRALWRDCPGDFAVAMTTFGATLTLGIQAGMAVGIAASLVAFIARTARPRVWDASVHDDELVVRIGGPLYFGNVDAVSEALTHLENGRRLRRVIVDTQDAGRLDSAAQHFIEQLSTRYAAAGIVLELRRTPSA